MRKISGGGKIIDFFRIHSFKRSISDLMAVRIIGVQVGMNSES